MPPANWSNITSDMLEPYAGPTFTPWAAYYPPMNAILMYSLGYVDKNKPGEGVSYNEVWFGPPSMGEPGRTN